MKTRIKSRILNFIMAALFIMTCSMIPTGNKAYAVSTGPAILITEIAPMSQDVEDKYEYIELYNNSDDVVDLKDYKLPLQNIDFTASKVIPPKGIMVVCTSSTTTLTAFNAFYGASLSEGEYTTLPIVDEMLSNTSAVSVILSMDDSTVVARAEYDADDFEIKKSITYKYPISGFDMLKLGEKQVPTPGRVDTNQVSDNGIRVTGVTLDRDTIVMDINQTVRLFATVAPATASDKSVVWISKNPNIVQVDENGVLTSKAEGEAEIAVKTVDGGFTAYCDVFVGRIPVEGVALNKTSITLDIGQAVVLSATISPADATNKQVTWSSSNSSIASVDSNGVVVAKSIGTAVISVKTTDSNYSSTCTVTVVDYSNVNVTGVSLNKTNTTIEKGKAVILEASVSPYNAVNKRIAWSSTNPHVAFVDQNGVVNAKEKGMATITARTEDGGYTASCLVTVTEENDNITSVTTFRLNKEIVTVKSGKSHRLIPIITPGSAKNIEIKWEIDDGGVAEITQDGWVKGIKEGYAKITATTKDGAHSAICVVHVRRHDNGKSKWNDTENSKSKGHGRWK